MLIFYLSIYLYKSIPYVKTYSLRIFAICTQCILPTLPLAPSFLATGWSTILWPVDLYSNDQVFYRECKTFFYSLFINCCCSCCYNHLSLFKMTCFSHLFFSFFLFSFISLLILLANKLNVLSSSGYICCFKNILYVFSLCFFFFFFLTL